MYLFGHHHDEHSLWKLVCVALACVVVVFGLLFMFSGCASGSALDLSAVKLAPAGDIQAVKTGDIAPIKAPIKLDAKIEATGQAGMTNTVTRVSANGDLSQVTSSYNDSTVMKKYITLMQYIIYSLAGIIAILIGFIGTCCGSGFGARTSILSSWTVGVGVCYTRVGARHFGWGECDWEGDACIHSHTNARSEPKAR